MSFTINFLRKFGSGGEECLLIYSEVVLAAVGTSESGRDSEIIAAVTGLGTIGEHVSRCDSISFVVSADKGCFPSEIGHINLDLATLSPGARDAIVAEDVVLEVAELEVSGETV